MIFCYLTFRKNTLNNNFILLFQLIKTDMNKVCSPNSLSNRSPLNILFLAKGTQIIRLSVPCPKKGRTVIQLCILLKVV